MFVFSLRTELVLKLPNLRCMPFYTQYQFKTMGGFTARGQSWFWNYQISDVCRFTHNISLKQSVFVCLFSAWGQSWFWNYQISDVCRFTHNISLKQSVCFCLFTAWGQSWFWNYQISHVCRSSFKEVVQTWANSGASQRHPKNGWAKGDYSRMQ